MTTKRSSKKAGEMIKVLRLEEKQVHEIRILRTMNLKIFLTALILFIVSSLFGFSILRK